jgi:hypothetical protein
MHTLCGPKCCSSSNSVKSNGRFPTKAVYGGWVGRGTSSRGGYLLASLRSITLQEKTSRERSGVGIGGAPAPTRSTRKGGAPEAIVCLGSSYRVKNRVSTPKTLRWRGSTHGRLGDCPSRLPRIHSLNDGSDNESHLPKTRRRTGVAQELVERHFLAFLWRYSRPLVSHVQHWDLEAIRMIASISTDGCYR